MITLPRSLLTAAFIATLALTSARAQLSPPSITVVAYTGEQDPNQPTGSVFLRFFTPEIGPFLSVVSTPTTDGSNSLIVTGMFSDYPDAIISAITPPSGSALLTTFRPGVGGLTAADNVALLDGDLDYSPDVNALAQTGTPADGLPEGVTIKKFMTLDGNGDPFFFATLQGNETIPANSLALCTFDLDVNQQQVALSATKDATTPEFPDRLNILLRVGDSILVSGDTTKIIKAITTLVGSQGTLADGRWRTFNDDSDEAEIGVRLTFTDGTQSIYLIPSDASEAQSSDWTFAAQTGFVSNIDDLDGATITSFGLPGFDNEAFALLANLKLGPIESGSAESILPAARAPATEAVVTPADDVALITGLYNQTPFVLSRKGNEVTLDANGNPLTGVTIAGLSDPVVGEDGSVAFMITMAGLPKGANTGIEFYLRGSEGPFLLANAGASAPGVSGTDSIGRWASFSSLVLPGLSGQLIFTAALAHPNGIDFNEVGPIFVATLAQSGTVNATNNLGIWAVNDLDDLQLIFRTGQTVTVNNSAKTVRTFVSLAAAPGSVGAASGYDSDGDVAVLATFTDGSKALLEISIQEEGK